jgi:hypothetical protein
MKGTKSAIVAIVAAAVVITPGAAFAGGQAAKAHITHADRVHVLKYTLPYYGKDAPSWCEEDMMCWTGSNSDGRSDDELYKDLRLDNKCTSWAYADQRGHRRPKGC